MDMAIIFISHDLRIVRKIADRIAVMKDGRIVEQGDSVKIFEILKPIILKINWRSFMFEIT